VQVQSSDAVENFQVQVEYSGNTYELCALKIDADGQSFMGFQKTITRLLNSHLYANHRTDSEFTSVSTASDDDSDDCWGVLLVCTATACRPCIVCFYSMYIFVW